MTTAKELAGFIINAMKRHIADIQPEEFDVTPLKLQKLLYYCQAYSLALTGKPAFSDTIEAWKFGPVVDSVYQEYKKYSGRVIPIDEITQDTQPDESLQSIIDFVVADKGQYSGEVLARMTHKESPWLDCYGGIYTNHEIPNEKIYEFFSAEILKREEDYADTDNAWDSLGEPVSTSDLEAVLEEI